MNLLRPIHSTALAISASLLLSIWAAYAQPIPNPDAVYYLRAAELFSIGRWSEGFDVFRWPFYSLCISAFMAMLGVSALAAAQIVNAICDCGIVVVFIALVRRLSSDRNQNSIALFAALIIALHPRLTTIRATVIRDHGFYLFSLLTMYFVANDFRQSSMGAKLAALLSIIAATLFRVEALFLTLIVPAFYVFARATSTRAKAAIIVAVILICALLIPGFALWSNAKAIPDAMSGKLPLGELFSSIGKFFETARDRANRLAEVLPPGRNAGGVAYIGISIAIVADTVLRALTFPIAALSILAFTPKRVIPEFAAKFVLWFAGWQIMILLVFVALSLYLDWRYALVFGLLLTIPAVFTLDTIATDWKAGVPLARYWLPMTLLAVVIPWVLAVPRPSHLDHLRKTGDWIITHLPPDAKFTTNDIRITYYAGRPLRETAVLSQAPALAARDLIGPDYVAFDVTGTTLPPYISPEIQNQIVTTIEGKSGRRVMIFKLR